MSDIPLPSSLNSSQGAASRKLDLAKAARTARCGFSPSLKADIPDSLKAHLYENMMSEAGLEKVDIFVDDSPLPTKLEDGGISGGVTIRYTGGSRGTDYEIISLLIDTLTELASSASKRGFQFFVKDDSLRITAQTTRDLVMLLNQPIVNQRFKIKFTAEDEAYSVR